MTLLRQIQPFYASKEMNLKISRGRATNYTHHQKCVLLDTASEGEGAQRRVTAYIGRWRRCILTGQGNIHMFRLLIADYNEKSMHEWFDVLAVLLQLRIHSLLPSCNHQGLWTETASCIGGVDLTIGRYDDADHSLFGTQATTHSAEYYQNCIAGCVQSCGGEPALLTAHGRMF